tara:strand:+ start:278 stop:472 length:195 start_codon:yes stop_codon:yes gene_type:complete
MCNVKKEFILIWQEEQHIKGWIKELKKQVVDGYDKADVLEMEEKLLTEHYEKHKVYYDGIPYNN